MEGGELFDQIAQRGSFTEFEAYQVMRQVADGLLHLHSHGYMHRDLKVGARPRLRCGGVASHVRGAHDMQPHGRWQNPAFCASSRRTCSATKRTASN